MNHVDIILAIPLAIGAIRGFTRGLILEVASLVGIVAGIYVASLFAHVVAKTITAWIDWNPHAVKLIAFVIVFIGVVIVVNIFARFVEKVFKLAGLTFLNRLTGLAAGTLKMAFILSVVLIFFNYINREESLMSEDTREKSFLYNPVSAFVPSVLPEKEFLKAKETMERIAPTIP